MVERRCRYCERTFQPSKYQSGQSVCSDPGCQRRRSADERFPATNDCMHFERTADNRSNKGWTTWISLRQILKE